MTWDQLTIGILQVIVGFLQVLVGCVALVSLCYASRTFRFAQDSFRKQMNSQMFLAYTERFEKVMDSFPDDFRSTRLNSDFREIEPRDSEHVRACMLKYLNLCSEELHLKEQGILAPEVWSIWQTELTRMLTTTLFKTAWPALKEEYKSHESFCDYVEKVQREQ